MRSLRIISLLRQPVINKLKPTLPSTKLAPLCFKTGSVEGRGNAAPYTNTRKFSMMAANLNQKLFSGLFQFIKKNRYIPEALKHIGLSHPDRQDMLTAIKQGNPKAAIFKHEFRDLFVLDLIKHGHVPYAQGMTIDTYFTALMQYTHGNHLKKDDAAVKSLREIKVDYLTLNNELTDVGRRYINALHARLKEINFELDREQFIQFLLKSPVTEKLVIKNILISPT